jgi:hypothetical protein
MRYETCGDTLRHVDPLADVFDLSRVSGAVMAQLIAYEPWGVAVDPLRGAVFHAVVAGSCWLRMSDRAPRRLMPGDVVLLPTNTPHELAASVDGRTESLAQFEKDSRRMDLAARRLRDTEDTVGAIASAVGYRSEYSFSRAFARHRGIAPGRYRSAHRHRRRGSQRRVR